MSQRRARVLFLSHAFMVGGAEEMVLNLVRHLPERFEPVVCCIHEPGPIGEEIRRTGVRFEVLGLTPGWRRPGDVARIARALSAIQPDVVHTFLLTASLYGRLAAMLARVPIIIGTEVNIYERKRPHHALIERALMWGTDRVVVSAESVREFYVRQVHADPAKIDVVYNAVDFAQLGTTMPRDEMRRALGVSQHAPVAGIIARLTEQKGHRVLFDALAQDARLANLHLVVVGDGDLRDTLRQRVDEVGLASRVHMVGARRDLGNILGAIDVFVLSSFWEGLPLAMVLAMGAGLPVVATRVAGIPEVVTDQVTGLLVPPGDAAALGAAVARVVAEPALGLALGLAARAFVTPRFGVDGYIHSITGLYDRLLAAKGLA